jgi:hypothetical protein
MVLTLWRYQKPSLCERLAGTAAGSSQVNENRPEGLSLGRLPACASWRLHGNHSAHQGSLKLRDRVHVPGSFRRLQCRHTSMVGRLPAAGNWIYRPMMNPGSGRHQDAARTPPPAGPRPASTKVVDAAACTQECARCRNHTLPLGQDGPAAGRQGQALCHCLEKAERFNTPPARCSPSYAR